MMRIHRTDSTNPDFMDLVSVLDADLKIRDGKDHDFYHQFNGINEIRHCVTVYDQQVAVGCGALKPYDATSVEIKRMFVMPEHRRKGIATTILAELETWGNELEFSRCILETGIKQSEAIALYRRSGYKIIPNYGPYVGIGNSVCFEKTI